MSVGTTSNSSHPGSRAAPSLKFAGISFVAGGIAGCAAKTIIAPLDRVKILFQSASPVYAKYTGSFGGLFRALRAIYHEQGVFGLFQGHHTTLLKVFPYAALKFMAYEEYKSILIHGRDQDTPFRRLVAGSLAGVTSVSVTYPLELVRVRQAVQERKCRNHTVRACVATIWKETPLLSLPRFTNFYKGFLPTVWGMIPYAGVSFMVYDGLGSWFLQSPTARWSSSQSDQRSSRERLTWWAQLARGGIAGAVGQTVAYPLEIIRRRMQVSGAPGFSFAVHEDGAKTTYSTARRIWASNGLKGFFVGLSIGYLKVVPMSMTSFFVYEIVLASLSRLYNV